MNKTIKAMTDNELLHIWRFVEAQGYTLEYGDLMHELRKEVLARKLAVFVG